ncbi:dihydrodipicolinate synthetase family protein [Aspergillus steynii IBT 23096]|uniref:Dihydrodipicolinate synthetase family protein n=1 Tax=Aspergillus steynii IBT 23096 TaxID=1392250 RepID=A0A2I2G418_9EURO|nr:dihydrodipicolinate synthetase family protein [Aspergillus steynii IBT 23096]PLB47626.1 dihydrodipicolinate synthetase family protein [Aspergillus steynii IBT 23096]
MPSNLPFPPGIHVPSLTFFSPSPTQTLNLPLQEAHLNYLLSSPLHGIVLAGTNGEAATLTPSEKSHLIKLTRSIAHRLNRPKTPITVGTFGGSTHAIIDDAKSAAEAGADYVLVLVPGYFAFAMDDDAIVQFFEEVADNVPVPVVVYNFPGVVGGLNVSSQMLERLGEHRNIVAVKLTCGSIASVTRTAARFGSARRFIASSSGGGDGKGDEDVPGFVALAGQSDWLVPCLSVGGAGCITGLANLFPKTCVEIYNLYTSGQRDAAEQLQQKLAVAEWGFAKGGINGTKWVVGKYLGYDEEDCWCRRPYPKFVDEGKRDWIVRQVQGLKEIEEGL